MNIAVIKLKDLIKCAFGFIIVIIIISVVINVINRKEEFEKQESILENMKNSSFLHFLKMEIPLIANYDKEEKKERNKKTGAWKILGMELSMMENLEDEEIEENESFNNSYAEKIAENEENVNPEEENKNVELENSGNLNTEVIDTNNIKASYTDTSNSVQVNNQTGYDIKDVLENPNYEIKNKDKIVIYHTHTCESYTSSEQYKYEMTGSYRTTDLNYTVSKVGDELEKNLKNHGKTIIHDKTYHDYPSYNGSYGRSLKTLEGILEKNKDTEIAIDLHRDAIGSSNTYGPKVKIGEDVCAQVMFVIGSDGSRTIPSKLETKFVFCNKNAANCK